MDLVLASNSPRRKEILLNAGFNLKIIPSNYDEKICGQVYSNALVENCAYNKALEVKNRIKENLIIIGADTVVVLDDMILGKPKDALEAFNMLKSLSNKTHFVATSICLIKDEIVIKDTQKTNVTFRKLSDEEIRNYIKTKKPFDKAGSYGIQDEGFDFATSIEGELNNVIGFPLELFKTRLCDITNKKL